MIHASVATPAGEASLADAREDDIEAIVRFWHEGNDDLLDYPGIDRARLGGPERTRARYRATLHTGAPDQMSLTFAISLDGRTIGYTLLNRHSAESNHSHWHIMEPGLRGAGISSALYPHRINMYFDLCPAMERLIHQTRTHNVAANRMLDKWVPVAETCYVDNPDGMALPGEFHLRYVTRADVSDLMARGPR